MTRFHGIPLHNGVARQAYAYSGRGCGANMGRTPLSIPGVRSVLSSRRTGGGRGIGAAQLARPNRGKSHQELPRPSGQSALTAFSRRSTTQGNRSTLTASRTTMATRTLQPSKTTSIGAQPPIRTNGPECGPPLLTPQRRRAGRPRAPSQRFNAGLQTWTTSASSTPWGRCVVQFHGGYHNGAYCYD